MNKTPVSPLGSGKWIGSGKIPISDAEAVNRCLHTVTRPVFVMDDNGKPAVSHQGRAILGDNVSGESEGLPLFAHAPALTPDCLGDPVFKSAHGLTYPYVAGAMANGINSVEMVEAMGKAGMIGFFGAAGLSPNRVEAAVVDIQIRLADRPYGFNLIHSPHDPALEAAVVALYLKYGVRRVSASAYLRLTPHLVYYRLKGIHRDARGTVICPNHVVAKVSRIEVARQFFSPAPDKIIRHLIAERKITEADAELAREVPIAHDLTAEADSGGHTDNRPALTLFPTIQALKDEMAAKHGYARPLCVGLGGGIATPDSTAAAFAMGAAYVITGTVNQACIESGTCDAVRTMLAEASQADVIMAPAADMFEMGVKVQVLKRGTMFAVRAGKLYDLYKRFACFDEIPDKERTQVERDFLRCSFSEEWENTRQFFTRCDPRQVTRAEADPHHKMALVFRSYLGRSSKWSVHGEPDRQMDYQIWCGPAIGAFNQWVRGSFLEQTKNRKTVTVAMNLLLGAAVATRINWLRCQGIRLSPQAGRIVPLPLEKIEKFLEK